jgi:hypothetical protein
MLFDFALLVSAPLKKRSLMGRNLARLKKLYCSILKLFAFVWVRCLENLELFGRWQ